MNKKAPSHIPHSWHLPYETVIESLGTNGDVGLSIGEAQRRMIESGPNRLASPPKKPWWKEIAEEMLEPMILLLFAVGIVYALLGELRDAIAIFVIVIAVLAIEIGNETKAKGAIKALSKLSIFLAPVIRDGNYIDIPTTELVPGDIVMLRPGERIPADMRLIESTGLRIDESILTGESVSATKEANTVLPVETELAVRKNITFSGTLVTGGKGKGVVVGTGMNTEIGKMVSLIKGTREPRTPLQLHMRELTRWMVWIALGFSALVALLGWIGGAGWRETILTGLTLAFATIPEELPILITMVLGLGAFRLAKQQAIVRRLRTAETLGNITVVATDKTGTLTENQMYAEKWFIGGQWIDSSDWKKSASANRAIHIGVIANDGFIIGKEKDKIVFGGDPTDIAFYRAAELFGYSLSEIKKNEPQIEYPLEDANKRITVTTRKDQGEWFTASKGAPEEILKLCDRTDWNNEILSMDEDIRRELGQQVLKLAAEGYRIIGLAYKTEALPDPPGNREEAESNLIFVGLAALLDPVRKEVPDSVDLLRQAGIRVMMITGDHAATAGTIGKRIGFKTDQVLLGSEIDAMTEPELAERLHQASIYARTTPEQKLRIVRVLQSEGEIVAVTGDGVNDGPALKEASVGVAMGRSGTDVAKETADMVLADDNFATLTVAIKEGRKLFANLYKAIRYYLAAKVALISSTLLAVLIGLPVPFAPIHIILLELFMDLGAATSFTAERPEADLMKQAPRRAGQPFVDRKLVFGIFSGGFTLAITVLMAYVWAIKSGNNGMHAQTVAFSTWMVGHLILALMMRSDREPLIHLGLFSNRVMLFWIASAIGFLLLTVNIPYLQELLHLTNLHSDDWLVILSSAIFVPMWIEARKWWVWRNNVA